MNSLGKRIRLLEQRINPPGLHIIDIDFSRTQENLDAAKQEAAERYQRETGRTCQPGDRRIFLVDFTGVSAEQLGQRHS